MRAILIVSPTLSFHHMPLATLLDRSTVSCGMMITNTMMTLLDEWTMRRRGNVRVELAGGNASIAFPDQL